jgi:mannose-6-phosphate isomerase-like protein (cupin superfamily)
MHGYTLLGDYRAEVTAGYAMPIPPGVPHGFQNLEQREHWLPFIFGSRELGGWGVLLDVEPQPCNLELLQLVRVSAPQMNRMAALDKEIDRAARLPSNARWPIARAEATYRPHSGGLELMIARVGRDGMQFPQDTFRIIAVVRGRGAIQIGPVRCDVRTHDHVGVPASLKTTLLQSGDEPLVVLEAALLETPRS